MKRTIKSLKGPMDLHEHGKIHPQELLDSFERIANEGIDYPDYFTRDRQRLLRLEGLIGKPLTRRSRSEPRTGLVRLTRAGHALLRKIREWRGEASQDRE